MIPPGIGVQINPVPSKGRRKPMKKRAKKAAHRGGKARVGKKKTTSKRPRVGKRRTGKKARRRNPAEKGVLQQITQYLRKKEGFVPPSVAKAQKSAAQAAQKAQRARAHKKLQQKKAGLAQRVRAGKVKPESYAKAVQSLRKSLGLPTAAQQKAQQKRAAQQRQKKSKVAASQAALRQSLLKQQIDLAQYNRRLQMARAAVQAAPATVPAGWPSYGSWVAAPAKPARKRKPKAQGKVTQKQRKAKAKIMKQRATAKNPSRKSRKKSHAKKNYALVKHDYKPRRVKHSRKSGRFMKNPLPMLFSTLTSGSTWKAIGKHTAFTLVPAVVVDKAVSWLMAPESRNTGKGLGIQAALSVVLGAVLGGLMKDPVVGVEVSAGGLTVTAVRGLFKTSGLPVSLNGLVPSNSPLGDLVPSDSALGDLVITESALGAPGGYLSGDVD